MKTAFRFTAATIITIILILTAFFAISGTVAAQDRGISKDEQQYLKAQEENYVRQIRTYLAENGYSDSGVAMNRITNEDGSMEYTVKLHHRKLLNLDEAAREALFEEFSGLDFEVENCGISYEIF